MGYESSHFLLLAFLLLLFLPPATPSSFNRLSVAPGWNSLPTEPKTPSSQGDSYVSEILSSPSYIEGPKGFAFAIFVMGDSLSLSICIGRQYAMAVPIWKAESSFALHPDAFLSVRTGSDLDLIGSNGSVAWSVPGVAALEMHDSGNLLMFDKKGVAIWESFKNSSDTILQNQPLAPGMQLKGKSKFIDFSYSIEIQDGGMVFFVNSGAEYPYWLITSEGTSWADSSVASNFSSIWEPPCISKANNTQSGGVLSGLSDLTFSINSSCANLSLIFNKSTDGIPDFLRLDDDGRLRGYTYVGNEKTGTVVPIAALDQLVIGVDKSDGITYDNIGKLGSCDVPNACGSYGICRPGSQPLCSCPPDFKPKDEKIDGAGCYLPKSDVLKFVKIEGATFISMLFTNWNNLTLTLDKCLELCKSTFACEVAFFKQNTSSCLTVNNTLSLLHLNDTNYSAFVKIGRPIVLPKPDPTTPPTLYPPDDSTTSLAPLPSPSSSPTPTPTFPIPHLPHLSPLPDPSPPSSQQLSSYSTNHGDHNARDAIIVLSSVLMSTALIAFVARIICSASLSCTCCPEDVEEDEEAIMQSLTRLPRRFSYKMMETATDGFRRKLGSGAFGSVYEGFLPDGRKIAVKKLEATVRGQKPFLTEVAIIGALSHVNVVRLVGFSLERENMLLVYDYMERGSLDRWLFNDESDLTLDWKTRLKIAIGAAHGLAYLHDECAEPLLHLDIKPHNILLDADFTPKLSDFGLSKVIDRQRTSFVTGVRGTPGYIAPEWLLHSNVTKKCDVYSFGMVLLEMIGGRRNVLVVSRSRVSEEGDYEAQYFPSWVGRKMEEGRAMEVVDERLMMTMGGMEEMEALRMMKVAIWCTQEDPDLRPSMKKVVQMLQGGIPIDEPPLHSTIAWQLFKVGVLERRRCKSFSSSPDNETNENNSQEIHPSLYGLAFISPQDRTMEKG